MCLPFKSVGIEIESDTVIHQVVISNATMINSLKIKAVNEMATIFKNSFSNSSKLMIMIAPPEFRY